MKSLKISILAWLMWVLGYAFGFCGWQLEIIDLFQGLGWQTDIFGILLPYWKAHMFYWILAWIVAMASVFVTFAIAFEIMKKR